MGAYVPGAHGVSARAKGAGGQKLPAGHGVVEAPSPALQIEPPGQEQDAPFMTLPSGHAGDAAVIIAAVLELMTSPSAPDGSGKYLR